MDERINIYKVSFLIPEREKQQNQSANNFQDFPPRKRNALLAVIGFFTIVAMTVIVCQLYPTDRVAEELDKSIAVRPFWNENFGEENEAFTNGISEEIRINLTKIADLRVASRESVEV